MPTENRTRVEFYLPVRSDLPTYQAVLDWLVEDLAHSRGGATITTPFAGVFAGGIRETEKTTRRPLQAQPGGDGFPRREFLCPRRFSGRPRLVAVEAEEVAAGSTEAGH